METSASKQFRALFIYEASREIDATHPLWNEILIYAQNFTELHILVFLQGTYTKREQVTKLAPNVFVYYVPTYSIFLNLGRIWSVVKRELVWQRVFRPDFILNFGVRHGAVVGFILSKLYGKKYFLYTTGTFLELPYMSRDYLKMSFLTKWADAVFVTGENVADIMVARTQVSNEKISVIHPPTDLSFLNTKTEYLDYIKKYPQHNLYVLSQISLAHRRGLIFLMNVFREVIEKYPRVALVLVVPPSQMTSMKKFVSSYPFKRSIYIYHEYDDVAYLYGGAQIVLSPFETEEINMPVILALGLHLPVVTTPTGIAKEIFQNSRYAEFMCTFGDVEGFAKATMRLIENQAVRDDYRLNSPILLKSLTLQSHAGYVASILASIDQSLKN